MARPERDAVYDALCARLDHFTNTQDETVLLDAEAQAEAERLHYLAISFVGAQVQVDMHALYQLAWYHWFRYACLPAGDDLADLSEAVRLFGTLRQHNPDVGPTQLDEVTSLPSPLTTANKAASTYAEATDFLERYRRTRERKALDCSINELRRAARLMPDHEARALICNELAGALRTRFEDFDDPESLDQAVDVNRELLQSLSADAPESVAATANLGNVLQIRYERRGDPKDIDEAIAQCRSALSLASPNPDPTHMAALANALRRRSLQTLSDADLDEALRLARKAVIATASAAPEAITRLCNLAGILKTRYDWNHQLGDLDDAIKLTKRALKMASAEHPYRHRALANLGGLLAARHAEMADPDSINGSVEAFAEALDGLRLASRERSETLAYLGRVLQLRASVSGDRADLDRAVERLRESITLTDVHNEKYPARAATLGSALLDRVGRYGMVTDLDDAIAINRAAVAHTPALDPGRRGRLTALSTSLRERARRRVIFTDLDEAEAIARQVVVDSDDPGDRAVALADLGNVLLQQFEMGENLNDLDAAVHNGRAAAMLCPAEHRHRAIVLSQLVGHLKARFDRLADRADLNEAVQVGREALAAGGTDQGSLGNLGAVLQVRFKEYGSAADLVEAIELTRRMVAQTPQFEPSWGLALLNLGGSMYLFFQQTDEAAALDESIGIYQRAARALAGRPLEDTALMQLAQALLSRFDTDGDERDLNAAIQAGEAAAAARGQHRANALRILSRALRRQHAVMGGQVKTGTVSDLDRAVAAGREAIALTPPDHPNRASRLVELGRALATRFRDRSEQSDLNELDHAWTAAMNSTTAGPGERLSAAIDYGALLQEIGEPELACNCFNRALELLPLVAWHGLDRPVREARLSDWTGVASDAAATAIAGHQRELAVEFLEQGRSILWDQWLQPRGDFTALSRAEGRMAGRLTAIRDALATIDGGVLSTLVSVRTHLLNSGAVRTGVVELPVDVF